AGEALQALALLLPAAIAYVTPDATEFRTASSSAVEALPPRLMLATAGEAWLLVTQSTPAMTPEVVPDPLQLRTRTAYSFTPWPPRKWCRRPCQPHGCRGRGSRRCRARR